MLKHKMIIGKKIIDISKEVFIISEIGINHEGDVNLCAKMIKESVKAGADAIKLQTIDADENYLKDSISYSLFKKAWLTKEETSNMFDYARSLGLQPFTTVGDFKTLEWVKRLKPKIYKISSGLITHIPLIKKISSLKETIIISTGTANKRDLDIALGFIKINKKKTILLHCVSIYPTPYHQANLSKISKLRKTYKLPVGYSDHVLGFNASIAAVNLGCMVIEKHFTLDKNRKSFDHRISLEPDEFKDMVKNINLHKSLIGNDNTWVSEDENKNKKWMRRILVARTDLEAGHKIVKSDVMYMRPGMGTYGLSPIKDELVFGKIIKKKILKYKPIKVSNLND